MADAADGTESASQSFDHEEVKALINQCADSILGQSVYQAKKVGEWTAAVVEGVLKNLQSLNKPFKYVVTAILMQRNGAGLHTASTCFWDTKTDGTCSVRWDNKTLHAIVTVYALHI